jgi:hypothetical protein
MVKTELEIAGLKFNYNEPSTLEEAMSLVTPRPDGSNPVLDAAIDYVEYHKVFSTLRRQLVDWIEKNTGTKRTRKKETNEKGVEVDVITEKEVPFIKRAIAEDALTVDDAQEQLQVLADKPENDFARFLNAERRAKGPKKLPKDIEQAVAKADENGQLEALANKLSAVLGEDVECSVQAVGEAMHKHRKQSMDAALRAAQAQLFS